jgi:hypothetical protein
MKIVPAILSYLLFLVCLAAPPLILLHYGDNDLIAPKFWLVFFFISGLTFLVVCSILVVQLKNKEYYVQAFLAATTVKILGCLFFIVIFLLKNKVNKYAFLADFFYIYLLNMGFEVYILLRNLRHKNLR